jgi:lysophospholipase L1-like esterase
MGVLLPTSVLAVEFTPLGHDPHNSEDQTGLWFCPRLGAAEDIVPLKTRLYATKESVTGGVALRVDVAAGSTGTTTLENSPYPAGTAGITMYAKASEELELTVKGRTTFEVTRDWQKVDLSWERLGTTRDERNIGYQFEVGLAAPADHDVWYIVDRLGCEGPEFDPHPTVTPASGPDPTINTSELVGNAHVLAPTVARLEAKRPFKIVAFGASVTAGAQATGGNCGIQTSDVAAFLYFSHLARLLEERYGYSGVGYDQNGYGGWTSEQARKVMGEVFAKVHPEDVVILDFGGNDLGWAQKSIGGWLADLNVLVDEAKKRTSQIIILSITTGGQVPKEAERISKAFRDFAVEQEVAYVDITRWSMYRGPKYAWAYLANEYHPDFMGHIMMAEIMLPLFTGKHFDWPPYAAEASGAF